MPLTLKSTGGGSVTLDTPSTASAYTLTVPAATATLATTTGTLTNPTINGFTGNTSIINVGNGQFYKDTSGNIGIGISSPGVKLDVVGSGSQTEARVRNSDGFATRFSLANTNRTWSITNYGTSINPNGAFVIADETAGAVKFTIQAGGSLYLGGTDTSNSWLVAGGSGAGIDSYRQISGGGGIHHFYSDAGGTRALKAYVDGAAGAYTQVSDANLKADIEPARNYLDDLSKIEIVKYRWKNGEADAPKFLGVIAQQVETVFPGLVKTHTYEDGREQKMVAMDVFVPMLIKSVQELSSKLAEANARIAALEAK